MIDSFGYQVLSLDEIILQLTLLRKRFPDTGAKPVWIDNVAEVYLPVQEVQFKMKPGGQTSGLHIRVAKP